jgi:hypothetical protein
MPSEYEKWKKQVELAKAKRDKELGKHEMLMATLKEKYQVESLEQLEEEIAKVEKEYQILEAGLEEKTNEFREKFAVQLELAAR